MPSLAGATGWLNSQPLDRADLRGHVVLVNFWRLSCINWLRQEPYIRAWSRAYQDDGLIVVGVHTPEFSFEHDIGRVRRAAKERGIDYAVAVDSDYGIWNAFANRYWPTSYLVDANGIIRDHYFGEGRYEQTERVIQRLLGIARELVPVEGAGVEAPADWDHLRTLEIYLGYQRGDRPVSPGGAAFDRRRTYEIPSRLGPDTWALAGEWTIASERVSLERAGGRIACCYTARDAHAVLSPGARERVRFSVLVDGGPPGRSHGVNVAPDGRGILDDGGLYHLVRERNAVRERTLEITFIDAGVDAYALTFG